MIPLTGVTYFAGGALCLLRRTAPLGSFLSAPLGVIVPFNVLLARQAGPWIAIVLAHVFLLFAHRAAFVPLWSYRPEVEVVRHPGRLEPV